MLAMLNSFLEEGEEEGRARQGRLEARVLVDAVVVDADAVSRLQVEK